MKIFSIPILIALLGCKAPTSEILAPASVWISIHSPTPALADMTMCCPNRFSNPLPGFDMNGRKLSVPYYELLEHPFGGVAVFERRNDWLLLWNEKQNTWFWWKPDYETIPVPSHRDGLITTAVDEIQRRIRGSKSLLKLNLSAMAETEFSPAWVLNFHSGLPSVHSEPHELSTVVSKGPFSPWCLVSSVQGDWIEIIPGIDTGTSGDGKHPIIYDATHHFAKWLPEHRGWVKWRTPGPVPRSKLIKVR